MKRVFWKTSFSVEFLFLKESPGKHSSIFFTLYKPKMQKQFQPNANLSPDPKNPLKTSINQKPPTYSIP